MQFAKLRFLKSAANNYSCYLLTWPVQNASQVQHEFGREIEDYSSQRNLMWFRCARNHWDAAYTHHDHASEMPIHSALNRTRWEYGFPCVSMRWEQLERPVWQLSVTWSMYNLQPPHRADWQASKLFVVPHDLTVMWSVSFFSFSMCSSSHLIIIIWGNATKNVSIPL